MQVKASQRFAAASTLQALPEDVHCTLVLLEYGKQFGVNVSAAAGSMGRAQQILIELLVW